VLTPAEWRVLHWVRHGLSRRQVAALLRVSDDAVRYHVRNIRAKLDLPDQPAVRRWAGRPAGTRAEEVPMSEAIEGIGQVSLFIRDVDRATRFYGEVLGLPHLYTFGDLVFFDCGGTRLYLHRVPEEDWRPGSVLYLRVRGLEARFRALGEQGVAFSGAPHLVHKHDDGVEEWMAFFDDGEGNTLALLEQLHPTK
jgi:catechol 2,3-dioxygenase-like lactoylglutathione lyase family enzyme/DNA-binding CsgD family transcriptional regulator